MRIGIPVFLAAGLAWALAAGAAQAQPGCAKERPIRLVVPFPAGGGTDIVARRLGDKLRQDLGQTVVVDNRAGASGNIGADNVAKSAPDGCTLMLTAAPFAIAPAVFKNLPFDPVRDFTAVAQVAVVPLLVVTRTESPLKTVADLAAAAKARPGALSYATFGNGAPPHLVGERMQALGQFRMTHVPYKGGQAALPDLLSGQLDVAIMDVVSMVPLIQAGRLRALAITGPRRAGSLPDVPTLAEAGVQGAEVYSWQGLAAPKGLPPDVKAKLGQAAVDAIRDPAIAKRFTDQGLEIVGSTPAEFTAFQARENTRWKNLIQTRKITID
jgi:tripartite-type tricarboxylate transporter receptor subunit TctC